MTKAARATIALLLVALSALAAHAAPPTEHQQQRHRLVRRPLSRRGRVIDRDHPMRRQVRSERLLGHALALIGGADVATLPRHVRTALAKKVRKPVRSLRTAKGQGALLSVLRHELGDAHYEHLVGKQAVGLKKAVQQLDTGRERAFDDGRDMGRGWGWRLLPKNDKAFFAPGYLAGVLRETGQTGAGSFVENSPTSSRSRFLHAWSKIAPANTEPVAFTMTGSDANNLMLGVAASVAERNAGRKVRGGTILTFSQSYVAGRGPMARQSYVVGPGRESGLVIESPHTESFSPKGAELARVIAAEHKALGQLRAKVKSLHSTSTPVGALLLESILGAKGVYVYRPQFLRQLRAVCDELRVPIIADEILTGGGRTGKFFAYEHYSGFEPDFVTFGKGLQVAGVARVTRGGDAPSYSGPRGMVTKMGSSVPLLKGVQVLERIRQDNLIANAAQVGEYFLSKLRQNNPGARGVGLLLYGYSGLRVRGAMGRLMPYLTMTKTEVDTLFNERDKYSGASKPSR